MLPREVEYNQNANFFHKARGGSLINVFASLQCDVGGLSATRTCHHEDLQTSGRPETTVAREEAVVKDRLVELEENNIADPPTAIGEHLCETERGQGDAPNCHVSQ